MPVENFAENIVVFSVNFLDLNFCLSAVRFLLFCHFFYRIPHRIYGTMTSQDGNMTAFQNNSNRVSE